MDNSKKRFQTRAQRVRTKIAKVSKRPRVTIYKSNKHIYAQIISSELYESSNTFVSKTLAHVSTLSNSDSKKPESNRCNKTFAKDLGERLGAKAIEMGILQLVLDRGGYKYHGVVKEFTDALRSCSIEI